MSGEQQGNASAAQAGLRYGPYSNAGTNYVGKTVAQVRTELNDLWGVPEDATAFSGKEQLADTYVIAPGDQIEFHRKMGEKG